MTEAQTRQDLALNREERRTFLLLVGGHALFVLALFSVVELLGDYGLYIVTALFGLPLLLFGPQDRIVARAFVLLFGFALVNFGATVLARALYTVPFTTQGLTDLPWVCGAVGGAAGAAGSFLLCAVCGLLRPGKLALLGVATLVLTGIGAFGLELILADGKGSFLLLYTPWQLAFAYFLAKTLR